MTTIAAMMNDGSALQAGTKSTLKTCTRSLEGLAAVAPTYFAPLAFRPPVASSGRGSGFYFIVAQLLLRHAAYQNKGVYDPLKVVVV